MNWAAPMVSLLEADSEVGKLLSVEERLIAERLRLPVETLTEPANGTELSALLAEERAVGAIVLDGMLVRRLRVGEHVGIRLLGEGDIIVPRRGLQTLLLAGSQVHAAPTARVALLTDHIVFAIRRWPRITVHLLERFAEQSERLEAQLMISQLPRVDQRLLALMWLLAERWGRVTPNGTALPLKLTHEALGALVGARRPTVTIALGELADRGALIKCQDSWLLTEAPPACDAPLAAPDAHMLDLNGHDTARSLWREQPSPTPLPIKIRERSRRARESAGANREQTRVLRARRGDLSQQLRRLKTESARLIQTAHTGEEG